MTEEEAKKKWCPMVRFTIGPDTATWQGVAYTNRCKGLEPASVTCIASDCMMWQQADRVEDPENFGSYLPAGYCGLVR